MMLKERQPFLAGNDRFEGYLADILLRLSLTVGFDYEIRLVRDGQYGMLGPMGYWDGMIGEVHRGVSHTTCLLLIRIVAYSLVAMIDKD